MAQKALGLRKGDLLAGKYLIDDLLGTGGMGAVVAAHHLGLDTKVALKCLLPEMVDHPAIVARFTREAKAAAKISNEHVVRVFDVGTLDSGAPYIVMELLDGVDLHHWLRQSGPLPIDQAVDFVLQACEGVAEAHRLGIVHRDLKPANLFCVRRSDGTPCIKVLDFGISKTAPTGSTGLRSSTAATVGLLGTPFYMSPEQLESAREVDARSDVWALGVILFELLTGRVPFDGETLPEVCIKVATRIAPPIRQLRPDVPPGIESTIIKCLSKNRSERLPTVVELAATLAPFAAPSVTSAEKWIKRTERSAASPAGAAAGADFSKGDTPIRTPESFGAVGHTKANSLRRRRTVVWLMSGAVACAVAIVAFLFGKSSPTAAPTVVPASGAPAAAIVSKIVSNPPAPLPAIEANDALGKATEPVRPADSASRPSATSESVPHAASKSSKNAPASPKGAPLSGTRPAVLSSAPHASPEASATSSAFDERL